MDLNDLKNFDCADAIQRFQAASDEMHDQTASEITSGIEYKAMLEDSIFQTRDILLEMQEASEKESKINRRRFWITLIVSLVAATAAVIAVLPCTTP